MIRPAMRLKVVAAQSAIALAAVLVLAGCGILFETPAPPSPEAAPSLSAPGVSAEDAVPAGWWEGRFGVRFTADLPPQWNDFTQEYLGSRDDPVLAAVWSTGETSGGTEPFATVSAFPLAADAQPRKANAESVERWAAEMTDSVLGPRGYFETAAGGMGYWTTISGWVTGGLTTIFSAHVLQGPYVLYIVIETNAGTDDPAALALLDALNTVEFAGPIPIEGRQGPPLGTENGGRWDSYCGLLSASPQEGWEYTFTPDMDATPWRCPEPTDYVGSWLVDRGEVEYDIVVSFRVGTDAMSTRQASSTHGALGEAIETPNGYLIAVTGEVTVALDNSLSATRIAVTTKTPSGFESHTVAYYVELGAAGTVEALVSDATNSPDLDTAWLEPFLASLQATVAS